MERDAVDDEGSGPPGGVKWGRDAPSSWARRFASPKSFKGSSVGDGVGVAMASAQLCARRVAERSDEEPVKEATGLRGRGALVPSG